MVSRALLSKQGGWLPHLGVCDGSVMKECSKCHSCFPDSVDRCERDGEILIKTLPDEPEINSRYRLEKRLGLGSVSIVYLASDLRFGAQRAVKIILPEIMGNDSSAGRRLLHEVSIAAAIQHPNIVAVTDSGLLNEVVPFIVMELISGISLRDRLAETGVLTAAEAVEYMSIIGSALSVAHQAGIVHRDLKPRNILIAPDLSLVDAIKISDFGLSQIKAGNLSGPMSPKKSVKLRSPHYLAPEEWSDGESDNRSDLYSLGVILYQMLAGDLPFKGRSIPAIMKQHLINPPPPIGGSSGSISKAMEAAVQHVLQKDPADRPDTVEEFLEELRAALDPTLAPISLDSTVVLPKKFRKALTRKPKIEHKENPDDSAGGLSRDDSVQAETVSNDNRVSPSASKVDLDQTVILSSKPRHRAESIEALSTSDQPPGKTQQDRMPDVSVDRKAPKVDLDSTIVLARKPFERKETVKAADRLPAELPSEQPGLNTSTEESTQRNLDQTIVLSRQSIDREESSSVVDRESGGTSKLAGHSKAISESHASNLDRTIQPRMDAHSSRSNEAIEISSEPFASGIAAPNRDPVSQVDASLASDFENPTPDAEELPRSISPVALAAGVILVILLIGLGVFYSHISQ